MSANHDLVFAAVANYIYSGLAISNDEPRLDANLKWFIKAIKIRELRERMFDQSRRSYFSDLSLREDLLGAASAFRSPPEVRTFIHKTCYEEAPFYGPHNFAQLAVQLDLPPEATDRFCQIHEDMARIEEEA